MRKEWEEARCPVCMESPHNAILLLCSSHEKGCRPYMCDTDDQLSNCFDQFCESSNDSVINEDEDAPLTCPLCRGQISSWIVNETAREFMNSKHRSCPLETCDFSGNYSELMEHASREHPSVRPAEADPIRKKEWETMVQQREFDDLQHANQRQFVLDWNDTDFSSFFVPTQVSFSRSILDNFFRHGHVLSVTSSEEELDNVEIEDYSSPFDTQLEIICYESEDSSPFNIQPELTSFEIEGFRSRFDIQPESENFSSFIFSSRQTLEYRSETNISAQNSSSRAIYHQTATRPPRRTTRSDFPYIPTTRPSRGNRSDYRARVTRQRNNSTARR